MTAMAAGLVPYAESVRTNSQEQVAQIATLLTECGVTSAHAHRNVRFRPEIRLFANSSFDAAMAWEMTLVTRAA